MMNSRVSIGTFQALTYPSFRILWFAGWFWFLCRMMEMVVMSWLILELTDSISQMAVAGSIRMLPMFIFGPFGGVLADRIPKRRIMIILQLLNFLAVLPMAALLATGLIQYWHVLISTFVIGTSWAIDFSVRRSYFTEILPKQTVSNAVALDAASFMGSAMLGPFFGGFFVSWFGFPWTYVIMSGLFVLTCIFLFRLKEDLGFKSKKPEFGLVSELVSSVKLAHRNSVVWAVVVFTVAFNFFGFPYMQMVPVIAREVLGVGSVLYGILGASQGFGSLVGALVIATRGVKKEGTTFSLGGGLMLVCVLLFALSPVYSLSVLLVFLAGIGLSGFATMQTSMVLRSSSSETRGRSMGTVAMGIGVSPLGILIVGYLAEQLGVQAALALLAGTGVITVFILRRKFPVLRDQDLSQLG